MAQTTPQIGLGTKVELSAVSPVSYAIFGFVTNVNGPQEANPLVDATHMLSTAKEYVYGVPEGGDIVVESHYAEDHPTHNAQTGILYFFRNKQTVQLRLTTPNAVNEEIVQALVTKVDRTRDVTQVMKLSVTFKITGAITVQAAGT